MKRVIGLFAAMLIFSLPAWGLHSRRRGPSGLVAAYNRASEPMFTCNTLGNEYMGGTAGSIDGGAGRSDWCAVCGGLGGAGDSCLAWHGVWVVQVNQFLATPLKGNKVEYDLMGTVPMTCSRSIFPQKGNPACWWLERHTSQWE